MTFSATRLSDDMYHCRKDLHEIKVLMQITAFSVAGIFGSMVGHNLGRILYNFYCKYYK